MRKTVESVTGPIADYYQRTLEYGVSVALDRFGLQGMVGAPFDTERVSLLVGLLNEGYGDRFSYPMIP
ncbi:hypothetical protein [Bacillus marinisedimentorum]|uniref:hypothetical protein n=1 Tax=Bacillus marinisedimentorum TaxID=1821260 RepID=UPI0007DE97B6|nr:hypothetical protein [Bacillus marinisedimentorum]